MQGKESVNLLVMCLKRSKLLFSLSLSEMSTYFCRSRQPAADNVPLLIIEQISKACSFIPTPSPSTLTDAEEAETGVMWCPVGFTQLSSYLSASPQFTTLHFSDQSIKTAANYEQTNSLSHHFLQVGLTLNLCVSQLLPSPVGRSACDWSGSSCAILSSQAFQQASDQETATLACTSAASHPTRFPNGPGRPVWLGEMMAVGVPVFIYERRCFVKIRLKVFHCLSWVKCVSDYTLDSCGGTLHESKCFWVCVSVYSPKIPLLLLCIFAGIYTNISVF